MGKYSILNWLRLCRFSILVMPLHSSQMDFKLVYLSRF